MNRGYPVNIHKLLFTLLRDEEAATAVEYGLILAMIVIALIASLQSLATAIIDMWGTVETQVTTV